jgi:sterol desaturase/sphingolipid hydroxylase (fatty acid hydroxylase superfamily)
MWGVYHLQLPWIEQYKINKEPWPWEKDRVEWINLMKRSLILIFLNNVIGVTALVYLDLYLSNWKKPFSFKLEDIPDPLRLFWTFVFLFICEDFAFHIFHRMAHSRYLYPYFHKYHHNYTTTVSLAGEHFHPVDFFFGALIPVSLGPNLLGEHLHITTYMVWIVIRTFESVDAHSGFEFPWSPFRLLPFSASATYHDYHHSQQRQLFQLVYFLGHDIRSEH